MLGDAGAHHVQIAT